MAMYPDFEQPDTVDLIGGLLTTSPLENNRRIFVNRNLNLESISWFGFDMDYTLARYAKREMEELSYQLTARRLVEKKGYPEEILDIPYDNDFVSRGLVIDKELGNILKPDRHGHIGRVFHGRKRLDREKRNAIYRNIKIRFTEDRYYWVDTLFALPEAALFASIIELQEKTHAPKNIDYKLIFEDIRNAIDACHRDMSLKSTILAHISRYIVFDQLLPHTLNKLRVAGKKLFLLTNSEWSYTDAVMRYLLHGKLHGYSDWQQYFDLIFVQGQKPKFFTSDEPFKEIDPTSGNVLETPVESIDYGHIYVKGSLHELQRYRPELRGDGVLYVGDHIYGDVIRSKKDTLWRTALIIEELEEELSISHQLASTQTNLDALDEHQSLLEHELTSLRAELDNLQTREQEMQKTSQEYDDTGFSHLKRQLLTHIERKSRDLKATAARQQLMFEHLDRSYSMYWGSVFREDNELSRFGQQVEEYACLYTSRVSNFMNYSPTHYFRKPRHWLPHEKA